jgi:hypothetical protein
MIRLDGERERLDVEETQRLLFGSGGVNSLVPGTLVEELEQRRAKLEPRFGEKAPDLWDAQTWDLAGRLNPVSKAGLRLSPASTIRVRLGRIPVLPDLQPERTPAEEASHARREAKSMAGFCGDAGDEMA